MLNTLASGEGSSVQKCNIRSVKSIHIVSLNFMLDSPPEAISELWPKRSRRNSGYRQAVLKTYSVRSPALWIRFQNSISTCYYITGTAGVAKTWIKDTIHFFTMFYYLSAITDVSSLSLLLVNKWDFRFSRRWVWTWLSSEILHCAVRYNLTDISEMVVAPIIAMMMKIDNMAHLSTRQSPFSKQISITFKLQSPQ